MKALVTGANGFLGSHIVKMLVARGDEVTAMTRRPHEFLGVKVREAIGDIRSYENVLAACDGQDVVFHTAAVAGVWGPWKLYHGTNTVGTKHVVEACREKKVPKLVYTSSPSVTFNGEHQINTDESAPYPKKWLCHYPHSKALGEQYVLDADEHQDLMTCSLRPHLIWGPGDNHLVPRLIDRAKSNKLRRVGDGTNQVDTIYIDNAAEAHLMAADALEPGSAVCGQAYFISQDDPVNLWEWINEVLAMVGIPRVKKKISFYWADKLGSSLEVLHQTLNLKSEPRMTRFLAAQLSKSHYFDISRAKRDFGYFPRVTNAEGMKRLAESLGKKS